MSLRKKNNVLKLIHLRNNSKLRHLFNVRKSLRVCDFFANPLFFKGCSARQRRSTIKKGRENSAFFYGW